MKWFALLIVLYKDVMFANMRIFQKVATGVLMIFSGLMVMVTFVAYSRQSGATRQDMAQAQLIRQEASKKAPLETPQTETAQR